MPDESPSDLLERLQRQRGRMSTDTDAKGSPNQLMEQIKQRNKKRQKEQYGVLTKTYRYLAFLVIAILIVYAVLFTPLMQYIFPVSDTSLSPNSSETPSVSMNTYLESAGLDVSKEVNITKSELHHDDANSWIEGDVQNNGKQIHKGVTLYFDLYDSGDKALGTPYIMVGEIKPGETRHFRTPAVKGIAASAESTYILGS